MSIKDISELPEDRKRVKEFEARAKAEAHHVKAQVDFKVAKDWFEKKWGMSYEQ